MTDRPGGWGALRPRGQTNDSGGVGPARVGQLRRLFLAGGLAAACTLILRQRRPHPPAEPPPRRARRRVA